MLQFTNVKKSYNTQLILSIPALQLGSEIYWVKGANGSGKTTFLKIVAGLLPFEGDILLNSISLKNKPLPYRQNVSWAEAEPLFPMFMTGMDLINVYSSIRKASRHNIDMLIGRFNMTGFINTAIGTYSAGMTKKLSLLLAFLGDVNLIVLDEPLITLDHDAFTLVCTLITERNESDGTTFLLTSHQDLDMQLLLSGKELNVSNHTVIPA
jgi:ABC-2 type transport system ATP-binding protein